LIEKKWLRRMNLRPEKDGAFADTLRSRSSTQADGFL
jgi:hypothetical protein